MYRYSALSDEDKKEVYDKWHGLINMSQKALDSWAEDDDRLLASINRQEAKEDGGIQSGYDSFHRIKRRKSKPFSEWSNDDFVNAKQEIGFNSRMLGGNPGQPVEDTGMSKWEISLKNWGHDPSLKSSPQYSKWKSWKEKHIRKEARMYRRANMLKQSCVIAFSEVGGKKFMFKNRDRNYVPQLKVFHTYRGGVEVVFFRDENTGWLEGINEFGIAVANSALMVLWDEKEGAKGKKKDNPHLGALGSRDASRILNALKCRTFEDALESVLNFEGGVRGHTIVSDGVQAVSVEHTARHKAHITDLTGKNKHHAMTNHGLRYPDAGYTLGENKKSSVARLQKVLDILPEITSTEDLIEKLYAQRFDDFNSPYNVVRRTDNMFTSSQLIYDFDKRKIILYLIPEDCEYLGSHKDFDGKGSCSFEVKRISHFNDDGSFSIRKVAGNPARVARLKMARIPSVGQIKRETCKPHPKGFMRTNPQGKKVPIRPRNPQNCDVWTKKDVETAYKEWRDTKVKDQKSYVLWKKYEGALDETTYIDPERVERNLREIEKDMNLDFSTGVGKLKNKLFGKGERNTVENTLGIPRGIGGGEGDPAKRKRRLELAEKKREKREKERAEKKRKQQEGGDKSKKEASDLDIFDLLAIRQKEASLEIIDDIGLGEYLDED